MSRENEDFLDPGEANLDAISKQTVTLDRLTATQEVLDRQHAFHDTPLLIADKPCQFLREFVTDAESGCACGIRQICLHPNHARARKLWGQLVLLTDHLSGLIEDMQTWAEHEAGIRGSRKIIKPVNPLEMAGKADRLYEKIQTLRKMLKAEDIKAARNFSDKNEFTEEVYTTQKDE